MDGNDAYVLDVFEKSGAGVSYVLAKDGATPSYMVTYGWSVNFGLPEFILCGDRQMLPEWKRIHRELIVAADAAPCIDDFHRWPITFKNHPLVSVKVDASNLTEAWFGEALAYRARAGLTGEMPAHQLFWSDRDGNPPWVEGRFALTMQWLQPPLYEPDVRPDDMRPRKDDVRHGADVLLLSNPRT